MQILVSSTSTWVLLVLFFGAMVSLQLYGCNPLTTSGDICKYVVNRSGPTKKLFLFAQLIFALFCMELLLLSIAMRAVTHCS